MQLHDLAALQNIAGERSSVIVFPLPIDLIRQMGRSDEGKD